MILGFFETEMNKNGAVHSSMYYGPPPAAPPSYSQAVGGVPPSSPFTPGYSGKSNYFSEK